MDVKMSTACLTCSANKYLVMISDYEWKILDYLLPPYSMKRLADLNCKGTVSICMKCQMTLQSIDTFRKTAFSNVFRLIRLLENESLTSSNTHITKSTSSPQIKTIESVTEASLSFKENFVRKEENPLCIEENSVTEKIENLYHIEELTIKSEPNYDDDDIVKNSVIEENSVTANEENTSQTKEWIVKIEPNDDDNIEAQKEQSKIMLDNVLQSMYVKKIDAVPSPREDTTSHPLTKLDLMLKNCDQIFQQTVPNPVSNPLPQTYAQPMKSREFQHELSNGQSPTLPIEVPIESVPAVKKKKNYVKYQDLTRKFQCSICESRYKMKYELHLHKLTHEKSPQTCLHCSKVLKNSYSFSKHLKNNHTIKKTIVQCKEKKTEPKKFTCDHCGNSFGNKSYLGLHIRSVHFKIRPHKCPQCARAFSKPWRLKMHVASAHDAAARRRDHVCRTCAAAFLTKAMLSAHMVIHTGERPYACSTCGATFGFKAALYTHNKLKHRDKQEKSEKQQEMSEKQAEKSEKQAEKSEKQAEKSEKQAEKSEKQEEKSEKRARNANKMTRNRKRRKSDTYNQ